MEGGTDVKTRGREGKVTVQGINFHNFYRPPEWTHLGQTDRLTDWTLAKSVKYE